MKKFTKVCLIICAALTVVGLGCLIAAVATGFSWSQIREKMDEGPFGIGSHYETRVTSEVVEVEDTDENGWHIPAGDYSFGVEEVKNLDIEIREGRLILSESEDEEIHVQIGNEKDKVELEGDTLQVSAGGNNWKETHRYEAEIAIQIPKGMQFREVDIQIDAGKAEIQDLSAEELEVEVGAGEVTTSGLLKANKVNWKVGAGKATIYSIEASDIELECSIGKLTASVVGNNQDYRIEAECGVGKMTIGEEQYTGLSDKKIINPEQKGKIIQADCSVGELSIAFHKANAV